MNILNKKNNNKIQKNTLTIENEKKPSYLVNIISYLRHDQQNTQKQFKAIKNLFTGVLMSSLKTITQVYIAMIILIEITELNLWQHFNIFEMAINLLSKFN